MPDISAFKGYRPDQIGVGNEGNTSTVNEPGLYFDPVSEKEEEVFMPAAADALVRMGWVRVEFEDTGKVDKDGNPIMKRLPTTFGRRPEDSPEVLKLRAELAAAQQELAERSELKEPEVVKPPKPEVVKPPKVVEKVKEVKEVKTPKASTK